MISRVSIQNFKSIGEPGVDLELKPLTLLVGPNGGGKSSILEAIAVAKQQDVHGELVSFPSWDSILHKPDASEGAIDIEFEVSGSGEQPIYRIAFDINGVDPLPLFIDSPDDQRQLFHKNCFLIPTVRGTIPFSTNTRREIPSAVGTNGDDLILLLSVIFGQRTHQHVAGQIAKWASRFGVGELKAGLHGGSQTGSDYLDKELKAVLNLALSSSGARQILTVITQLFWSAQGSLLMIEEPEISLHPQAQVDVLEMFAEAINQDNKQIIATTHSHIMLQALGYAVQKGWLERDDIAVYHIEKGKTGTKAKLLPLAKSGYIKQWVPSYTKVEKQLLREWAKTLPRE